MVELCEYKVKYFDSEEGKQQTGEGIVCGIDYNEVVKELMSYFGEQNLVSFELTPIERLIPKDELCFCCQ